MTYFTDIIHFWFEEVKPEQWWKKDADFDALIKKRFLPIHRQAVRGELDAWRDNALGALAEIIVVDQFSRNMFRNKPESFSHDALALCLAQNAIRQGLDQLVTPEQKAFLYLPFMHSESAQIHERAVKLFAKAGLKENLDFELRHKAIIDRFGRYPHRNAILNRPSTAEELRFLTEEGSSF